MYAQENVVSYIIFEEGNGGEELEQSEGFWSEMGLAFDQKKGIGESLWARHGKIFERKRVRSVVCKICLEKSFLLQKGLSP